MEDPEEIFAHIDIVRLTIRNINSIRNEIIRLMRMQYIDHEEESSQVINNNPNFMKEENMKYNLYPLYINWKKIEERKNEYYDVFSHFGYFGAAFFSSFKNVESSINLTYKNLIETFSTICSDFLLNSKDKEKDSEDAKEFMKYMPDINIIYSLIKTKVVMYKEIPIYIIALKIYEIYFLFNEDEKNIIELMKYQYLLISYLKDSEYKKLFEKYFGEKIKNIFDKIIDKLGKKYELPNSKKKYINHIKYIYQSLSKKAKDDDIKNENNN